MSKPIDFYFDFTSPYAYLGSTRIEALAAAAGREVIWHPVLLGAVFKTEGNLPLTATPLKGAYCWHDLARTARFHHIPYRRPSLFPLSTQVAARAVLWLQQHHGHPAAVRFVHAVYAAMFVEDLDVTATPLILQLAAVQGADPAALAVALGSRELKDALKTKIALALEQGLFGAPFVVVDDEKFWGFDRFPQIEAYLKDGAI